MNKNMDKFNKVKIVPDTSIIINGILSEKINKNEIKNSEIIIPIAVLDELQAQASKNQEIGFLGLEELNKIRSIATKKKIKFRYLGTRPSLEDIKLSRSGRIDAIIRDESIKNEAILFTGDYVQAIVAEAMGAKVNYIPKIINDKENTLEKFFNDELITSVHIKQGIPIRIKKGLPGDTELISIGESIEEDEINKIIKDIEEFARISEKKDKQIIRDGAKVIQLDKFRITITTPPFSDRAEVTIIKPIKKLQISDYDISKKLMNRIEQAAEGILVAGSPGSGKSTFASSLAEFYSSKNKIVKTIESPKDLQVNPEISQYGQLEGDFEKTAEILLLVRPDYTVFDEVRKTRDFIIFADLRLSGVGMIGVVHASNPVNSIQRFVERIEFGMISSVIDTVIFLKNGEISKTYQLELVMKVPTGMLEADLTRPVIEIRDFDNSKLEYEIYTYGEEKVIIPVIDIEKKEIIEKEDVKQKLNKILSKYKNEIEVEMTTSKRATVKAEKQVIPKIIGKNGQEITRTEKELGIRIDVEPLTNSLGSSINHTIHESGNSIDFLFKRKLNGKELNVHINNEYIFSATVGKKNKIRVAKNSEIGKTIMSSIIMKKNILITKL
jgi:ATPase